MKKIVCVLGSPRVNGNSETIARKILETAEGLGAQTQVFTLNKMSYKGCQACIACKTGSEECVIKDELAEVLSAAREADVLILASPIYFGQITAQLKGFVDRTYSFLKPTYLTEPNATRLAPGKKAIFIFTQGMPDPSEFDIFAGFDRFFKMFGYETLLIRGLGMSGKPDADNSEDLMKQAEEVAKQVMA